MAGINKQYCKPGRTYKAQVDPNIKPVVAPCEKPELCDPVENNFGPFKTCFLCGKSE